MNDDKFQAVLDKISMHLEVMNHSSERTAKSMDKMTSAFSSFLNIYAKSIGNDKWDKVIILGLVGIIGFLIGYDLKSVITGVL